MSTPRLVADIKPGSSGSFPSHLTAVGTNLFFRADDGISGRELWKSDGTSGGTNRVADFSPGSSSSYSRFLTAVGSTLFFTIRADDSSGYQLWKSDGTSDGTTRVAYFSPGSSDPRYLTALGSTLFFSADDGSSGHELWKSDGTSEGTTRVADIYPGSSGSNPRELTAVGSTLFFSSYNGSSYELWKSDGTSEGTTRAADIPYGSIPRYLTAVGSTLFFSANDGSSGQELWKSDGTSEGTILVADIRPGNSGSSPRELTAVGSTLFFSANDGSSGYELWKSDGTSEGTTRVVRIRPGLYGSNPRYLTAVGSTLFFSAHDSSSGTELWKSDGTSEGTTRVADISPDWPGSDPMYLTAVGSTLFFSADDGNSLESGTELWALDVGDDDLPVVTLAVSPASVTEDGSANLIYIFSRTGSTTAELSVNYTVGGTATLGIDYTGIAATPATKTISFAAGSATASLTVDPISDSAIEADENKTIALTLVAGSSYSVGTTAAVVGTIRNDDVANNPATRAAITRISDNTGLIKGNVASAGRSNDRTPTLTGTLSAPLATGDTLRIYNGNSLLGTAKVNNTGRSWSYTPRLPATSGRTYSFTARVADAAGNLGRASAARKVVLDTTAPRAVAFSPRDGATAVELNTNLRLSFSESIRRGTGVIQLRTGSASGAIRERFDAATSNRLSISGSRLSVDPSRNLLPNTRYVLTIPAGAITDRAGNRFSGSTSYDLRTINAITGDASSNLLPFSSTVDRITGLGGRDTFRLASLRHALLPAAVSTPIDRITDLASGIDRINAPVARPIAQALNPVNLGAVADLRAASIADLLTPENFPALSTTSTAGAASFSYADPQAGPRTFLAINNTAAGFSPATDAILEITGFSGNLNQLQVF